MSATAPAPGEYTVDDIPEDEYRYDLVDGVLIMTPRPTPRHEFVVRRLDRLLCRAVNPDRVLGELDVVFDERNLRQPDLVVVHEDVDVWRTDRLTQPEILLAIEVVSSGSVQQDQILKRAQYAAWGIPHYWIVRTEPRLALTALELPAGGGIYAEMGTWSEGETVVIERPFPVSFAVTALRD